MREKVSEDYMEKNIEDIVKRKIRFRNEAYLNMTGEPRGYIGVRLGKDELNAVRERIYYESFRIDEFACNKVYTQIVSHNKFALCVKKIIRKLIFKILGWYYVPIVDGQVEYNMQVKYLLQDMQSVINSQQEQIDELEKMIKSIDAEE